MDAGEHRQTTKTTQSDNSILTVEPPSSARTFVLPHYFQQNCDTSGCYSLILRLMAKGGNSLHFCCVTRSAWCFLVLRICAHLVLRIPAYPVLVTSVQDLGY